MTLGKGSHDDDPSQAQIPGLKEAALTPEQKRAVEALKKLDVVREKRKATTKILKEEEQEALADALEALDGLGIQSGRLGPADFTQQVQRKLKLSIDRFWKPKGRRGGEAQA